jgi:hypothetical protein
LEDIVEVGNLFRGALGVVADAIAGLHGVDERVRRSGDRRSLLQGVVGGAQAGHGAGKSIELAAAGGLAGCAAHLYGDFGRDTPRGDAYKFLGVGKRQSDTYGTSNRT